MAEALLKHAGRGHFRAWSAGSHPTGSVNSFALETMRRLHLSTEGLRSKAWDEFAAAGAPQLDFVFTVCDDAAGEACPVWPGQPVTAHWGVEDPAAFAGSDEDKRRKFMDVAQILKRRIDLFTAIPLEKLDAMALSRRVKEIGKS